MATFGARPVITAGGEPFNDIMARWWPYAGLVYFHLLLDALAGRDGLADAAGQAH